MALGLTGIVSEKPKFINQKGDAYIRLVTDAGIFTYTDDIPILFMKGYLYDTAEFKVL